MSFKLASHWLLTHAPTVLIWIIGKPHAEDFIEVTVGQRFQIVEQAQQKILDEHETLVDKVVGVERLLKEATEAQAPILSNQERIIKLLEDQQ
jgi:hypothetical protein